MKLPKRRPTNMTKTGNTFRLRAAFRLKWKNRKAPSPRKTQKTNNAMGGPSSPVAMAGLLIAVIIMFEGHPLTLRHHNHYIRWRPQVTSALNAGKPRPGASFQQVQTAKTSLCKSLHTQKLVDKACPTALLGESFSVQLLNTKPEKWDLPLCHNPWKRNGRDKSDFKEDRFTHSRAKEFKRNCVEGIK
jgi:hypothetical protein